MIHAIKKKNNPETISLELIIFFLILHVEGFGKKNPLIKKCPYLKKMILVYW